MRVLAQLHDPGKLGRFDLHPRVQPFAHVSNSCQKTIERRAWGVVWHHSQHVHRRRKTRTVREQYNFFVRKVRCRVTTIKRDNKVTVLNRWPRTVSNMFQTSLVKHMHVIKQRRDEFCNMHQHSDVTYLLFVPFYWVCYFDYSHCYVFTFM